MEKELHKYWSHLREEDFTQMAISTCGRCVIPVGSWEMHGQQLPAGKDMLIANAVIDLAA